VTDVSSSKISVVNDPRSPESFSLSGSLNRDTVPDFWQNSLQQLANAQSDKPLLLNLEKLTHIDTAGLAWLINLIRDAKTQNIEFSLLNPPDTLLNLAKISDVDGFLPLQ
jgi:phospholipid transport system transporter-binding protein